MIARGYRSPRWEWINRNTPALENVTSPWAIRFSVYSLARLFFFFYIAYPRSYRAMKRFDQSWIAIIVDRSMNLSWEFELRFNLLVNISFETGIIYLSQRIYFIFARNSFTVGWFSSLIKARVKIWNSNRRVVNVEVERRAICAGYIAIHRRYYYLRIKNRFIGEKTPHRDIPSVRIANEIVVITLVRRKNPV